MSFARAVHDETLAQVFPGQSPASVGAHALAQGNVPGVADPTEFKPAAPILAYAFHEHDSKADVTTGNLEIELQSDNRPGEAHGLWALRFYYEATDAGENLAENGTPAVDANIKVHYGSEHLIDTVTIEEGGVTTGEFTGEDCYWHYLHTCPKNLRSTFDAASHRLSATTRGLIANTNLTGSYGIGKQTPFYIFLPIGDGLGTKRDDYRRLTEHRTVNVKVKFKAVANWFDVTGVGVLPLTPTVKLSSCALISLGLKPPTGLASQIGMGVRGKDPRNESPANILKQTLLRPLQNVSEAVPSAADTVQTFSFDAKLTKKTEMLTWYVTTNAAANTVVSWDPTENTDKQDIKRFKYQIGGDSTEWIYPTEDSFIDAVLNSAPPDGDLTREPYRQLTDRATGEPWYHHVYLHDLAMRLYGDGHDHTAGAAQSISLSGKDFRITVEFNAAPGGTNGKMFVRSYHKGICTWVVTARGSQAEHVSLVDI